ncbi:MAG: monovalent cation/H+ antiporter subunit D [Desulfobulbaceae bacterium]|nr:monovalent cation/H+ antiporter subunit D [Desulfobulbaceae bacterium]
MNHWIIVPLLLPLLAGMVNLLLVRRGHRPQRLVSLLATVGLLGVEIHLLRLADTAGIAVYRLGNWAAPFGIVLVLDRLSALMLLTTGVVALGSLLFAINGDDRLGPDFHVLFPLQLFGINGAFLTGDLFNLFVFFEILLIASYCLALHGGGPVRIRAGLHYVVLNLIGSSLFLIAIGTLYGVTGTLNMADLAVQVVASAPEQATLLRAGALLLLVVFGLKAALPPLHPWLPALYSGVVAPVAALFAIMTKVGVYAILRIYTLVFSRQGPAPDVAADWLLPMALLTLSVGAMGVLASRRLRVLVAYLVVVSVGTLLTGIAQFNVKGVAAALYYLPHTTLVTAGLFLLADLIAAQRGESSDAFSAGPPLVQPNQLGVLFFFGAVAATGLPPLSGFIGKLLLLQSVEPERTTWFWGVVLVGGLAGLVALSRAGTRLFWDTEGEVVIRTAAAGPGRLVPVTLLLLMIVAMTVCAAPISRYAEAAALQLLTPRGYIAAVLFPEQQP